MVRDSVQSRGSGFEISEGGGGGVNHHSLLCAEWLYSVGLTTSDPPSVLVILSLYACLDSLLSHVAE